MIKIAASNSSAADKATANVICAGANDQNTINAALGAGKIQVFLFNGTYQIDAPIDLPNEAILIGNSMHSVELVCNTASGLMRSSAPASQHEHVLVESMYIVPGSSDDLACDLRGFTRSQFNRLRIYNFDLAVWFGGTVPTYHSSWTNIFSRFYLSENLVGFKMSGIDTPSGAPSANQIIITEGEIVCRNASGAMAIDAVDAGEMVVNSCDIGYGNQADGIVLRSGSAYTRVTNSRFEWSAQASGKYPIKVESGSFYNFFSGNNYSGGCRQPNMYDANGANARYIEIDDFARNTDFPNGYVDFNIDVLFSRSPTLPQGLYLHLNKNSALGVAKSDFSTVLNVNTNAKQVALANGTFLELFSDEFTTSKMYLNGSNGRLSLAGDITPTSAAPSISTSAAAGTGATASISGTNISGLITLNTGTSPGTGKVLGLAWSSNKPSASYAIVLSAANANAVNALTKIYVDQAASTASDASIAASAALTASTTYKFYYTVVCY